MSDRKYDDHKPLVLTGAEGLPPKPTTFAEPMAGPITPAVAAPLTGVKIKEDPRAAAGRKVSYLDMDGVAEGDVELSY